jgi:hypothetical protein
MLFIYFGVGLYKNQLGNNQKKGGYFFNSVGRCCVLKLYLRSLYEQSRFYKSSGKKGNGWI